MSDCMPQTETVNMINAYVGSLSGWEIRLNTSSAVPTPVGLTESSVVEPTGSWYSPISTTPQNLYQDDAGNLHLAFDPAQFNYGSSTSPAETVYGWATTYTISSTPVLFEAGILPQPVVMSETLDAVTASPDVTFSLSTIS